MSYPEKHIAIVCNPTRENEKALRVSNTVMLQLKGLGIRHELFVEPWPDHWDGYTEVWIMGGDGTVNYFINQYPDCQLPLAVFAGGSGNDFHWMLYGDLSVETQVENVLKAAPQTIDAGRCNGKLFVNGVGIGFDGAIVKDLLGRKKLAGKASYLLAIMKHIIGYHEKPCTLQMPGETFSKDCMLISIANARRYGGGFHVAPIAMLNDGLLDINVVGKISPLQRMKYLPVMEKGAHLDLPFVDYRQKTEVKITAPVKLHAHIDGEYIHETFFDITVLPNRFSFLFDPSSPARK